MATPEDLDRLRGLLKQLMEIGSVKRGEIIRADAWNILIDSVADIARAVLAAETASIIPGHKHLDDVTPEWLAPQLRQAMERGILSDPVLQNRLSKTELAVSRLNQRLEANETKVEEFKGRLTDVATRDLVREAAITSVRRAIDNIDDPRSDIRAMRDSLNTIHKEITTVQDIASKLSADGKIIDVGEILKSVADLKEFRESLRTANGELLDAAAIERRLAEVSVRAVSQEQLDEVAKGRRGEISQEQFDTLLTLAENAAQAKVNASLESFRVEVSSAISAQAQEISRSVAALRSELNKIVQDEIKSQFDAINRGIDEKFSNFQKTQDEKLVLATADIRTAVSDDARQIALETVKTSIK